MTHCLTKCLAQKPVPVILVLGNLNIVLILLIVVKSDTLTVHLQCITAGKKNYLFNYLLFDCDGILRRDSYRRLTNLEYIVQST